MRMLIFTLFLLAGSTFIAEKIHAEDPKLVKALLIAGGCCHDYAKQQEILSKGIMGKAFVQVDVYWTDDKTTSPDLPLYKDANWAEGYDVIIHDECAANITDKEIVANIINAHKKVPAVNLHCAMHCYRTGTDDWFKFLGLQSSGHGPQKPIAISYVEKEHPITKGLEDWVTVNEELYNNLKLIECKPLARGKQTVDRKGVQVTDESVVAWTNETQGARSFSTTIGHNNETVADDRYITLVTRGLLWSCDKLKPEYMTPYKGENKVTFIKAKEKPAKPPKPVPEKNVSALKQPAKVIVTASSVQDGHPPFEAIDEDSQTRWCADGGRYPQWIQFEFKEPKVAKLLQIVWEGQHAYQFQLSGSNDGKSWNTLIDASNNKAGANPEYKIEKPAVNKFYRITGLGNEKGGAAWCSINEVILQGDGFDGLNAMNVETDPFKQSGNITPEPMKLTAEQEESILKDVKVAEGLEVSLFAAPPIANYPVYVAAAPNGDLYVSSDGNGSLGRKPGRGRILRLRDTNGDGRADEVTEFVKNVDSPRGLVWDNDRLYLLHPPDISVYHDKDGDGIAEKEETLIKGIAFGFKDRPADHTTNGLTLGIDGWLYIAGGDFGFMEAVGTDGRHLQHRGGGVIRFRPDGSNLELYSTGTRNILETPISPTMELFARDNTNDGGGWNVRFHHFTGLDDHGYPRMYINFNDEIVQPLKDYGGGSGCGAVYLSEPGFPAEFNHAPLTCDWGSGALWKHTVEPNGATYKEVKDPVPMVRMTRPTDADVDGMSRLYQASWKGATFNWEGPNVGYIVCVKPKGYKPEKLPTFETLADQELVDQLKSASHVRRLAAQRLLLSKKYKPLVTESIFNLANNKTLSIESRVAALYFLVQQTSQVAEQLMHVNKLTQIANDPLMIRYVLRGIGDLPENARKSSQSVALLINGGLKHADSRIRLEAIIAACRFQDEQFAFGICDSLSHLDPVVRHTAVSALVQLKTHQSCFFLLDDQSAGLPQKQGALLALMRMHDPAVVDGLIKRLNSDANSSLRKGIVGALARLYHKEAEWKGESWGTRPDTRGPYYSPVVWSESPKILEALKAAINNGSPEDLQSYIYEINRNRITINDAVDKILAQAMQNEALIPQAVQQLLKLENLPEAAIPLLIKAGQMDLTDPQLQADLIKPLGKLNRSDVVSVLLDMMVKIDKSNFSKKQEAIKAFLQSPILVNQYAKLLEIAKLNNAASFWAKAAVVEVLSKSDVSPEARQALQSQVNDWWSETSSRLELLEVVQRTNNHELDDRILAVTNDQNKQVVAKAEAAIKKLSIKPLPPDNTPKIGTLKPEQAVDAVLAAHGDKNVGAKIFKRANCAACHTLTQSEVQRGPYLGNIAKTYKRPDLVTNILLPNKTIAQGFATNVVLRDDGTTITGFITFESAEKIIMRDNQAKEHSITKDEILERKTSTLSAMPEGVMKDFTVYELASLVDYLESLVK
jgi:putative membrane-bound dehydrogenase-like protein